MEHNIKYLHRVALTFLIPNIIILRLDQFQPHPLAVIPSDYSYACINQLIVEDFVVEIHHGRFHFFVYAFFSKFLLYRSYKYFTRYFKKP